jgi:hypothetical protein
MVNLISFNATKQKKRSSLSFTKLELNRILSNYTNGVIKGYWKDYAIDQTGDISIFSIYRNSQERPTYCLEKKRKGTSQVLNFTLWHGSKGIRKFNFARKSIKTTKYFTENY